MAPKWIEQLGGELDGCLTIGKVWRFMTRWDPSFWEKLKKGDEENAWLSVLLWPPDVFALCAAILRRTGCYTQDTQDMQPVGSFTLEEEVSNWRCLFSHTAPDPAVWKPVPRSPEINESLLLKLCTTLPASVKYWTDLGFCLDIALPRIAESEELVTRLRWLAAAADEVCAGAGLPLRAGVPAGTAHRDRYRSKNPEALGQWRILRHGWTLLEPTLSGSSLCSPLIVPSAARVLPKMHIPTSGLTVRSLSHHLALCESDEVQPRWFMIPVAGGGDKNVDHINLLVLPYPLEIAPAQFSRAAPRDGGRADHDGYFDFKARPGASVADLVDGCCDEALERLGSLDGVIMPELALTIPEYLEVRERVLARGLLLVTGAGKEPDEGQRGTNEVCVDVPLSRHHAVHFRQSKHHRWKLDRGQIVTYGIGGQLNPDRSYWENIDVGDRRLLFLVLREWLVTSVLICEDLARHDPVGELLRGVAPHLVIALLMDGPQLEKRWSSRYAAALADDPGSSVLSVTNLGMIRLSRPPPDCVPKRTIALWKDAREGAKEVDLPGSAKAMAITLSVERVKEWSPDGRENIRSRPILTGVHPIQGNTVPRDRRGPTSEPVCFLAPHEAVDLARLVQQLGSPDGSPEVLAELSGEAQSIGLEVWRLMTNQPSPQDRTVGSSLPTREHTETAQAIVDWYKANLD